MCESNEYIYLINCPAPVCGIYKITSPSGKIYIGQAIAIFGRFWRRRYEKCKCEKQPKIYNSIKKHGWAAHKVEVVEICEKEKLNEREIYWGKFYDVHGENGLNLKQCGGSKGGHAKESNEKNRISHLGKYEKEKNPFWNKKHTKENNEINIKSHLNKKATNETRKKMSDSSCKKPILQFDLNGNFIARFESIKKARESFGIKKSGLIGECVKHPEKNKTAYGFIWKYENEDKTPIPKTKKIIQLDINGKFIRIWNSISEAHRNVANKNTGAISNCLKGLNPTAYGFIWKYA